MPSSATITTFYSFAANTKARASHVNTNFDVFRGHCIPVHPNTATSANNSYDLGSSEYYWANGYFGALDFRTSTSTATLTLSGDTSNTTGAFLFKIEGVTKAKIDTNGLDGNYIAPETVTIGSLFTRGTAYTSTASNGVIATSNTLTVSNVSRTGATSATYQVAGSTITLTTIGRPVFLGVLGDYVILRPNTFTSEIHIQSKVLLQKDAATVHTANISFGILGLTTTARSASADNYGYGIPLNFWTIIYPTAGAHNYSLALSIDQTSTFMSISNARLIAYEL